MALSIIGAGYGRTGTMSLQLALEQLGFAPCYRWLDAARAAPTWLDAFERKMIDWNKVFGPSKLSLDFPACLFYRDLLVSFPLAKVILTVRDCNSWFASARETYLSSKNLALFRERSIKMSIWPLQEKILSTAFGDQLDDRGSVIAHYEHHNLEVRRSVPSDRLLVYEIHQRWDPLCEFLGVPVPDTPFPHLNSKEEWKY